MMLEEEALGEAANIGFRLMRHGSESKKHLVVLRLDTRGFGGAITAANKLADTKAKFRQGNIFAVGHVLTHDASISQRDRRRSRMHSM